MSESWFEPIRTTVAEYATAALLAGEEAGAGMLAQIADALVRLQSLPDAASSAVADLTGAVAALFPEGVPHDVVPAADQIGGPPSPVPDGRDGPYAVPLRSRSEIPIRRMRVDPAGLARFLRAQHPHKPAEHAAALTGIPLDTVLKLLKRETLPMGRTMLAFIAAYGPEVLAAVLPDADARWLEGARILANQARLEAELERTRAEMAVNAGRWSFCGIVFGGAA